MKHSDQMFEITWEPDSDAAVDEIIDAFELVQLGINGGNKGSAVVAWGRELTDGDVNGVRQLLKEMQEDGIVTSFTVGEMESAQ